MWILLQASYITGGVYLKPQQLDGLFEYLAVSFYGFYVILHAVKQCFHVLMVFKKQII